MSEVKTAPIPPVALSRSVGSGGWALGGRRVVGARVLLGAPAQVGSGSGGSGAQGHSRWGVGVSSRAAEDQDLERRAQLEGLEGLVAESCVTPVADSCNVLGAWR